MAGAERTATDDLSRNGAVEVANPSGRGDFVIVCEHASNFIPAELDGLGLDEGALQSHIAWDPGALAVARAMAAELDSPLVAPRLSRLVYDCNRAPDAPSAVAAEIEAIEIPGNSGLSAADRKARADRISTPFGDTLNAVIDRRMAEGHEPVLVTVHSFTPVFNGVERDVEMGVLHDTDARFADALSAIAGARGDLAVRRNAPYGPEDGVTFTLAEYALRRGLLNAMIEIRNDLIADAPSQKAMAERLSDYVTEARQLRRCQPEPGPILFC